MTPQTLKLYELLGSKEHKIGCKIIIKDEYIHEVVFDNDDSLICTSHQFDYFKKLVVIMKSIIDNPLYPNKRTIWNPPTIADLHKWLNKNIEIFENWKQEKSYIYLKGNIPRIKYNSSLPLLDQPTETLDSIIELIELYEMKI